MTSPDARLLQVIREGLNSKQSSDDDISFADIMASLAKQGFSEADLYKQKEHVLASFGDVGGVFAQQLAGLSEPKQPVQPRLDLQPKRLPCTQGSHQAAWMQVAAGNIAHGGRDAGNLRLEEVPRIGQGIWRDVADSAEAVRVVCPLCGAAESVAQMAMHLMSHRTAVHASMPLKEREALAKLVEFNRVRLTGALEMFEALANSEQGEVVVARDTTRHDQATTSGTVGQKRGREQHMTFASDSGMPLQKRSKPSPPSGVVPHGGWSSARRGEGMSMLTSFPYLDAAFVARARDSRLWKSLISDGGEEDGAVEEMEMLSAIFPDMAPHLLRYALAKGEMQLESEDNEEDAAEMLIEIVTTSLEPWGALQAGDGGAEGEALYRKLTGTISDYVALLQKAQERRASTGEEGDEEEEDAGEGEGQVDEAAKDAESQEAKRPRLIDSEIWGSYRCDHKIQAAPSAPATVSEVQAGSRISLHYTDGQKGWWDCDVISLDRESGTAKVKFLVGGFKETIRWSEWRFRLYKNA